MKRILLVGANPYNGNKGVAALAISSIRMISEIMDNAEEDYEICIYNHEFNKTFDEVELLDRAVRIKNIFPTDLFCFSDFLRTFTSKWRMYNLREFLKVDYIFNITAGDGFSDIYGDDIFKSNDKINKLARMFHKKYYFLPQTYGPFSPTGQSEYAALKTLRYACSLMSRDKESLYFLINHGFENKSCDLLDVAFYLPFRKNTFNDGKCHIGINVSQTLWEMSDSNKFKLAVDYSSLMRMIIQELLSKDICIHLIPHVVDTRNNIENEYYINYRLWREFHHDNLFLAPFFLSPIDAKDYISALDLFVGARMHACIAAFSSGVPVLLMSYSMKFSGLFKESLGYSYILDLLSHITTEQVLEEILYMIDRNKEIKEEISLINETIVKNKIDTLREKLFQILLLDA